MIYCVISQGVMNGGLLNVFVVEIDFEGEANGYRYSCGFVIYRYLMYQTTNSCGLHFIQNTTFSCVSTSPQETVSAQRHLSVAQQYTSQQLEKIQKVIACFKTF